MFRWANALRGLLSKGVAVGLIIQEIKELRRHTAATSNHLLWLAADLC